MASTVQRSQKYDDYYAIAAIVLVIIVAYLPVMSAHYMHTDDYFWSRWGGFSCHDKIHFMSIPGRPLSGAAFCGFDFLTNVPAMSLVRRLGVACIIGFSLLVFHLLRRNGVAPAAAAALSVIIATLPPFQVYAGYLTTSVFMFGAVLAAMAMIVVQDCVIPARTVATRLSAGFAAVVLLIVSFDLFQPTALFYITLLAIPILLSRPTTFFKDWVGRLMVYALIFTIACGLYYLSWRVFYLLDGTSEAGKYDGRRFVDDVWARTGWFIGRPLVDTLNLWNITPRLWLAWSAGIAIVGLFCYRIGEQLFFTKPDRVVALLDELRVLKGYGRLVVDGLNAGLYLLFFVALLPVSYAINFVSVGPSPEYRTYGPLAMTVACLLFVSLYRVLAAARPRLVTAILAAAAVGGTISAHLCLNGFFVKPDTLEYSHVVNQIKDYVARNGGLEGVHIVQIHHPVAAEGQRYEIGEASLFHPPNVRPLVRAALEEAGVRPPVRVTISSSVTDGKWLLPGTVLTGQSLDDRDIAPMPRNTLVIETAGLSLAR